MRILPLLLPALLLAPPAGAELNAAARAAAALVAEQPAAPGDLFDKSFFRQISLEKLNGIFSGLYRENGPVAETVLVSSGAHSGHFFFDTERGWRIPAALSVDPAAGRITGLFFSPPYRKNSTLAQVKAGLAALPGRKGLLVRRLGEKPEVLESLSADEYFAVGPVFKLYVLGAMLKEKTSRNKVFRLRGERKSAQRLAALMLSEGDNAAADALIDGVGRRRVEAALAALGHSAPEKLTPFLKTSELFRLKPDTQRSLEYLNLPLAEKYAFLAALAREPQGQVPAERSPFGLGRLEWLASPSDVCRLLEYLAAAGDPGALGLPAMNPGLKEATGEFLYAGCKSGSGPGVLSTACLLKDRRGSWSCLAASWNDERHDLEPERYLALLRSALDALACFGEGPPAPPARPQGP